jgi:hypothetical protein
MVSMEVALSYLRGRSVLATRQRDTLRFDWPVGRGKVHCCLACLDETLILTMGLGVACPKERTAELETFVCLVNLNLATGHINLNPTTGEVGFWASAPFGMGEASPAIAHLLIQDATSGWDHYRAGVLAVAFGTADALTEWSRFDLAGEAGDGHADRHWDSFMEGLMREQPLSDEDGAA